MNFNFEKQIFYPRNVNSKSLVLSDVIPNGTYAGFSIWAISKCKKSYLEEAIKRGFKLNKDTILYINNRGKDLSKEPYFVTPTFIFPFGKYSGEIFIKVALEDLNYIHWCINKEIIVLAEHCYDIMNNIETYYRFKKNKDLFKGYY